MCIIYLLFLNQKQTRSADEPMTTVCDLQNMMGFNVDLIVQIIISVSFKTVYYVPCVWEALARLKHVIRIRFIYIYILAVSSTTK